MTAIIAGEFKGHHLQVPATGTRPTSARVREAIFSHLDHRDLIAGTTVLDLFAGAGSLGIEAVSRGAHRAVLVDKARGAIRALRHNIRVKPQAFQVITGDATSPALLAGTWDLVFIDPPYELASATITQLLENLTPHLGTDPTIVVERDKRSSPLTIPAQLEAYAQKTHGETIVTYLTTATPNAPTQEAKTQ